VSRTAARSALALAVVTALLGPAAAAAPPSTADRSAAPPLPSRDCRLSRVPDDLAEGFPIHGQALPATGTLRATLLLVDFPDAADGPASIAEAEENLRSGVAYLEQVSRGRLDVEVTTTPSWIRMPHPSSDYPFDRGLTYDDHVRYVRDAVEAADATVDFAGTDVVWVSATRAAPAISFSPTTNHLDVTADGRRLTHAVTFGQDQWGWGGLVLAHETGHTLGLPDLYLFDGPDAHAAVGEWDLMGLISGEAPELLAWHRWMLGWIDDDEVVCAVPGAGRGPSADLVPLADLTAGDDLGAGEDAALVLRLSDARAVVVENRQALRWDGALTRPGALVTSVDVAERTGRGPIRVVDATPGSSGGLRDATFEAGTTWTEPTTGTVLSFTDGPDGPGGALRVTVGEVEPEPEPEPPAFVDVAPGSAFAEEIAWLARAEISTGWTLPDGSREFRPVTPIERNAMAAFLYRLAGRPAFTPPTTSPFTDVATTDPFYAEIAWLARQRISTGWVQPDGSAQFRPYEPIARDAMAAFLHRAAGSPPVVTPTTGPFGDVAPGAQFAAEIAWLHDVGIATGWDDGADRPSFRPLSPVNRDAMAAFLHRFHHDVDPGASAG
jgi:M6 family metalloprotease-like protein